MYEDEFDDAYYGVATRDERMWAMICHLSALVGSIVVPFLGNIIAPLVIWLLKRDESSFIDRHGKEVLNFQTSMTIYMIISGFLILIVVGALLLPLLYVANLILTIIGAVKANDGNFYRYPFTIRFLT